MEAGKLKQIREQRDAYDRPTATLLHAGYISAYGSYGPVRPYVDPLRRSCLAKRRLGRRTLRCEDQQLNVRAPSVFPRKGMRAVLCLALFIAGALALQNGLGLTPQMGWNSWCDAFDARW